MLHHYSSRIVFIRCLASLQQQVGPFRQPLEVGKCEDSKFRSARDILFRFCCSFDTIKAVEGSPSPLAGPPVSCYHRSHDTKHFNPTTTHQPEKHATR